MVVDADAIGGAAGPVTGRRTFKPHDGSARCSGSAAARLRLLWDGTDAMNAKALIPLIAGLGIAGLAAKLGLDFLKNAEGKPAKTVRLWTPVEDIKRGLAIDKSMLRPLPFPADGVPQGALTDVDRIVGRVPHTGAPAGVPILNSMLLPPGAVPGVQVPPGLRAVALRIDESSGVDYHLEPGCHVDVVGLFTIRRKNRQETIARTVLENVEVAAVGQRLSPSTPSPSDEDKKSSRRERPARAVTLLVKPQDVPMLHLAEQRGKIKLSMRGTRDEAGGAKTPRVTEATLLGDEQPKPDAPQLSWRDQFNEFVGSLWKKDEPEKPLVETPAPAAEPQPQLAWVMAVYNGDERRLLGWADLDDFHAIELSAEGPNIFQDEVGRAPRPQFPPTRSRSGWQNEPRPGGGSQPPPPQEAEPQPQPEPEPKTDAKPDTESEPEELFE